MARHSAVSGGSVERELEARAVSELLNHADRGPAGLVVEGEAGIGKTTLLLDAADQAAERGFRVLSARGSPAEVSYAYAAVADLLSSVDDATMAGLPAVQRIALDRARSGEVVGGGPATDERVVATAFLSVIERISAGAAVLLAIDDAQWLDASSRAVIGFTARRLTGRTGMLLAIRTGEPDSADGQSWLHFPRPDTVVRIRMRPLSLGGVHALIAARLGQTLPRPTMIRIHETSGGNPLFAIELAASAVDDVSPPGVGLPDGLAALVRRRIGHADDDVAAVLLAAACAAAPTVALVGRATGMSAARVVELLEAVESRGVVILDGHRVRFTHPLFATGVYADATPTRRRAMHRVLASVIDQPELKARHLALAATTGDATTLSALDAAAEAMVAQGAPAVAAELIEMALNLGGDTPQRRIRAAEHHFRAGSLGPALRWLQSTLDSLPPGPTRCVALMLLGAVLGYSDDTAAAVQALTQAAHEAEDDTELRLHALLRVVAATVMIGRVDQAVEYAKTAVALADRLGNPELRSRALSIWVTVSFVYGLGVDRPALQTALELEDPHGDATTWYRASAVQAMISAWTGDLNEARSQMHAEHRRMLNGGNEIDIIWAANHLATIDVWLGHYADAARASSDAVERAEQMGGRHLLITAWGWQAEVAAYAGREAETRAAADAAVTAALEIGARYLVNAPTATLAFLEVSLGNYGAATNVLEPLLQTFDPSHHTELVVGSWLPEAIEALTGVGRVDEADVLVKALHNNGTRLDRVWMLAMAARGRALCLATRGDLPGAEEAVEQAMVHHDRLPMPFERARTQLLLGQLQRRRRHKTAAAATLREALNTFENIGTPLWSERARAELERLSGTKDDPRSGLTPAEQRIAQCAAAGLSNKEIATEQFLALKTVEMTLSSVYRKLGIRSRAQLHPRLDGADSRDIPASPPA
jgi:DNA-binding CsgD family transcriptional regulator